MSIQTSDAKSPLLHLMPTILNGDRIILHSCTMDDGAALWQAIEESRAHLAPWQDWTNQIRSLEDATVSACKAQADWILRTRLSWVISAKGQFLGQIQLEHIDWVTPSFGIGYWLRTSAEGHGYVTEATKLVCRLAFETLGAQRVHIECDQKNDRSAAVPKRLRFMKEAILRNERRDASGNLQNTLQFSMIPEEYQAARQYW